MKGASGEGEQECWFGEGGCLESSEMERSWRDCCYGGVNPATPAYGDKTGSNLDDDNETSIEFTQTAFLFHFINRFIS